MLSAQPVIPSMPLTCLIYIAPWLAFYPKMNECGTKSYATNSACSSWYLNWETKDKLNKLTYSSVFSCFLVHFKLLSDKKITEETKLGYDGSERKWKKRKSRLILDRLHFLCITIDSQCFYNNIFYTWISSCCSFLHWNFAFFRIKWRCEKTANTVQFHNYRL